MELPVAQLVRNLPAFYGNMKVHYHIHKSLFVVRILNLMNPVYTLPLYSLMMHFNIICRG
jgi:hypothetical protein